MNKKAFFQLLILTVLLCLHAESSWAAGYGDRVDGTRVMDMVRGILERVRGNGGENFKFTDSSTDPTQATLPGALDPIPPSEITQNISAEHGGTLEVPGGPFAGLKLIIPAGALLEDTAITVKTGGANSLGSSVSPKTNPALYGDSVAMLYEMTNGLDDLSFFGFQMVLESIGVTGLKPVGEIIRLEPSGLEFLKPVVLQWPYGEWGRNKNPHWLTAVHVSENFPTRIVIPHTVNTDEGTVSMNIEHFSELGFSEFFQVLAESFIRDGALAVESLRALAWDSYDGYLHRLGIAPGVIDAFGSMEHIQGLSQQIAKELACVAPNIDPEVPENVAPMNILLAGLSMMPLFIGSNDVADMGPVFTALQTGAEGSFLDEMVERERPATFSEAFYLSLTLNENNAYKALMTIHNVIQMVARMQNHVNDWGVDFVTVKLEQKLVPKLQPLSVYDSRITENRGAWYHIAGLMALGMRSWDFLPYSMATFDETFFSGLMGGHFEVGEQVSNLLGSALGNIFVENIRNAQLEGFCDPLLVTITEPTDNYEIDTTTSEILLRGSVSLSNVSKALISTDYWQREVDVVNQSFSVFVPLPIHLDEITIRASATSTGGQSGDDEVTLYRNSGLWYCSHYSSGGQCEGSNIFQICTRVNDEMPLLFAHQLQRINERHGSPCVEDPTIRNFHTSMVDETSSPYQVNIEWQNYEYTNYEAWYLTSYEKFNEQSGLWENKEYRSYEATVLYIDSTWPPPPWFLRWPVE